MEIGQAQILLRFRSPADAGREHIEGANVVDQQTGPHTAGAEK